MRSRTYLSQAKLRSALDEYRAKADEAAAAQERDAARAREAAENELKARTCTPTLSLCGAPESDARRRRCAKSVMPRSKARAPTSASGPRRPSEISRS